MRTLGPGSWVDPDFSPDEALVTARATVWEPACGGAVLRPEHETHEDYPLDPPEQWLTIDLDEDLSVAELEDAADRAFRALGQAGKRKKHRHG